MDIIDGPPTKGNSTDCFSCGKRCNECVCPISNELEYRGIAPEVQAAIKSREKLYDTFVDDAGVPINAAYLNNEFKNCKVTSLDLSGLGGVKFDSGKPDMSLLSSLAIEELTKVLDFGAKKYAANNWRKGILISKLIAATLRHMFALLRGETKDPETGLHHAAHAMCECMFIIETLEVMDKSLDDRFVVAPKKVVFTPTEVKF